MSWRGKSYHKVFFSYPPFQTMLIQQALQTITSIKAICAVLILQLSLISKNIFWQLYIYIHLYQLNCSHLIHGEACIKESII